MDIKIAFKTFTTNGAGLGQQSALEADLFLVLSVLNDTLDAKHDLVILVFVK